NLPHHLTWLQNITISLCIDQEGFRAIFPTFKLASTDPDSAMKLDVGMAEFMPLKRESFVFHYSTLDTSPSIRRLSVNGDESRDYLS
ncbi:hypothetical protein BDM02DRAFT_3065985, partial [Thelephora ganbajun]